MSDHHSAAGPRPPAVVRVFLLDDHELVRRGLRGLLEGEDDMVVVGESGSAREAVGRILAARPDVAVLDGRLPDGSGIEVLRQVAAAAPHVRALVLTSYDDEDALLAAVMAGASGYVLKQVRGSELVDAVRRVAAGESLLDPEATKRVVTRLRSGSAGRLRGDGLTGQEQRILALIAEGLTNRQIAARTHLAEKTVKNYVSSLLTKLGLTSRTQAALYATRSLRG